ncbi:MAG TPA: hypothetical protein VFI46_04745 [Jiangellaceae bacterium]|nr:hypothetical protein [Jiangellaceae bacterium]
MRRIRDLFFDYDHPVGITVMIDDLARREVLRIGRPPVVEMHPASARARSGRGEFPRKA